MSKSIDEILGRKKKSNLDLSNVHSESWNVVMPFGKHKGETLGDINEIDPTYLDWLSVQDLSNYIELENAMVQIENGELK